MNKIATVTKNFDAIIIGSGAAGLTCAIEARKNGVQKVAIISKVLPGNSHTVAAKGGINASLGNVKKDDWRWHAFDTIKGSDFLADKNAVEILCKNAPQAITDLEKIGVVFSRDENGKIAQRAYGAQSCDYGKGELAYRACYAKDKTGQTILHCLLNEAQKYGVEIFSEFFVLDLLMDEKTCLGCFAYDIAGGEAVLFQAKSTVIATGGYSQIYENTTSSLICTGDGNALAARAGLALKDMEFVQFHPTGISGKGFLISEAARGEGAYLLNSQGERFMKNYDAKMMELASRDVICRAIACEIQEGRGCGAEKNSIHLDLRHLSAETLSQKLPGIVEVAKKFAGVDVACELIEIAPTAHYTMGGIAVDINCFAQDFDGVLAKNLLAIGETSCVSVHGANRLGCNSLLDLVVFGKVAGQNLAKYLAPIDFSQFDKISRSFVERFENFLAKKNTEKQRSLDEIKKNLQNINERFLGVFRSKDLMERGLSEITNLKNEFEQYSLNNKSLIFNDEIILYFELENLFLNSIFSFNAAINRQESRGAHFRQDFIGKDDENWLCHSLMALGGEGVLLRKDGVL